MRVRHSVLRWLYAAVASLRSLLGRVLRRLEQELAEPPPVLFEPGEDPAAPHRPQGPAARPPEHWLRTVRERAPHLLRGDADGPGTTSRFPATRPSDVTAPRRAPAARLDAGADVPGTSRGDAPTPARPWGEDLLRRRHFRPTSARDPVHAPPAPRPEVPGPQGFADGPEASARLGDHADEIAPRRRTERSSHAGDLGLPDARAATAPGPTDGAGGTQGVDPPAGGPLRRRPAATPAGERGADPNVFAHEVAGTAHVTPVGMPVGVRSIVAPWDASSWAMDAAAGAMRPIDAWPPLAATTDPAQPTHGGPVAPTPPDPWPPLPPLEPALTIAAPVRRTWDPRARMQRLAREQGGRAWSE